MKKAGIIGGSGFIGSYVTKVFLDNGYQVKVSSTDITNKEKYQHLMSLKHSDRIEFAPLNVEDKEALRSFVSGCDIVVHGGTPFQLSVQDPQKDLFDRTIKGTENFLEVVSQTPGIEKVVLIASVASWNTNFPMPAGGKSFTDSFDENDTRFISNESHPYAQAKYLVHQAVEKFITEKSGLSFEITSVSPVMVMGRSLSTRQDSTSSGLQYLIKNKIAPDPFIQAIYDNDLPLTIVDVEDVARAIFNAATTKGLHGKDYLLTSETYKASDVNLMLNHYAPKENGAVIYQNARATTDLGVQFKPVRETLANYSN
ncbi:NAD-dependent epimerase/dehydratase family protein [Terrimonas sp. NA20]|uniref:NAD-dependent epimerase/dehydratase family protein n=1 Tax=Terrimonas ginsenosidimutans TaxID=2908004 RepID=A0ABS9KLV2_9BACT|nr:NAD-dependent epimerase/dehydratase family protein [Terrimonas ginsenosidimutans]MCG2613298.1 NAD-dependent epimerase/dehydratase family protein [Terrimonas ginsenosidimutans]